MNRMPSYNAESIYGDYLGVDGADTGRLSQAGSYRSNAGPDQQHQSLMVPSFKGNTGRNTAYSNADTASVYTNGTSPYERWSLEEGLLGEAAGPRFDSNNEQMPRISQPFSQSSLLAPPLISVPNSGSPVQRSETFGVLPEGVVKADNPIHPAPSPISNQVPPRRHFSRPFRPETAEEFNFAYNTPPAIHVQQHRSSVSTPDAYAGANFSPAVTSDSPRSSSYSSDIAAFPEPGKHLRRRSMPVNKSARSSGASTSMSAQDDDDASSVASRATAKPVNPNRRSMTQLSIIESEDEVLEDSRSGQQSRPHTPRQQTPNAYPFASSQHGFGADTMRSVKHKPSSRFSEDEKRGAGGFATMSSNNDFQSSTWNLFGRSAASPAPWAGNSEKSGGKGLGDPKAAATSTQARKKRRRTWIIIAVIALLVVAGVATGLGIWQNNVNNVKAGLDRNLAGSSKNDGSGTDPSTTDDATATTDSASPSKTTGSKASSTKSSLDSDVLPARSTSAVAGSGGPGGYFSVLAFGGSYADNGHTRAADLSWSLVPSAQYDGGRSCNGPVYEEYLATMVGPRQGATSTVFNYAYSGASVNNSVSNANVPDLPTQIGTYLSDRDGGNATVASSAANKTLINIWTGLEQLTSVWQTAITGGSNDPQQQAIAGVQIMLSSLTTSLSWLTTSSTAAKPDFALVTIPRGDLVPQTARIANNNTDNIALFKTLTNFYNNGLKTVANSLSGSTVYLLDAESLFEDVHSSPSKYNFTQVDTACMTVSCTDPDSYMWFDDLNPSSAMHELVARRLAIAILES